MTPPLDLQHVAGDHAEVNYDEFKMAFLRALRESGLPIIGFAPSEETLDLHSTERIVKVFVEPVHREIGRPFHISASISWRWDALLAARTRTTEEDVLTEVFGRENASRVETERSCLRVDIALRAGLEHGKAIPMPSAVKWAKWSREAIGRLETVERLVSDDTARETAEGLLAILAWQGDPEIKLICKPTGELLLDSVTVSAFQLLHLPRHWDDPDRDPDPSPEDELDAMFRRTKAALFAWGEVMDHLV